MRHHSQRDSCDCNDCDHVKYVRGNVHVSVLDTHIHSHTHTLAF